MVELEDGVMRKRRIGSIVSVGAAVILMLSGFDSSMTAEQLQEKSASALAGVSSMEGSVSGTVDTVMTVSEDAQSGDSTDVPVGGTVELSYKVGLEPLAMDIDFSLDAVMMGQTFSSSMQMIALESEDGLGQMFINMTDNGAPLGWSAEKLEPSEITKLKDMLRSGLKGDMSVLNSNSVAAETGTDTSMINDMVKGLKDKVLPAVQIQKGGISDDTGNDLYELKAELTGDMFVSLVTEAMQASGQKMENRSLDMVKALLDGLTIKITSEIDAGTCLPFRFKADMSDSDFSALADLLLDSMKGPKSQGSVQIDVKKIELQGTFSFDKPVEVTVPQEALEATMNAVDAGTNESEAA